MTRAESITRASQVLERTTWVGNGGRRMPSLFQIAEFWKGNHASHLPDLLTGRDLARPFCFRCGWRVPTWDTPMDDKAVWRYASGWLERAHLQDHSSGGPDTADNLVPLCTLCHRIMPEFPFAEDIPEALAWVRGELHMSCPRWWQSETNALWSSDQPLQFVGSDEFFRKYVSRSRRNALMHEALRLAESGDEEGASNKLLALGLDEPTAALLIKSQQRFYAELGTAA